MRATRFLLTAVSEIFFTGLLTIAQHCAALRSIAQHCALGDVEVMYIDVCGVPTYRLRRFIAR
jgi:hypothetical protein